MSVPGIEAGHAYVAPGGKEWLCLAGIQFTKQAGRVRDGRKALYAASAIAYGVDRPYQYLRWSAALKGALGGDATLAGLFRVLAASERGRPWTQTGRFSASERPREFIRDAGPVLDASSPAPAGFDSPPRVSPDGTLVYSRYQLYERNRI